MAVRPRGRARPLPRPARPLPDPPLSRPLRNSRPDQPRGRGGHAPGRSYRRGGVRDAFATENRFGGLRPTPPTGDPLGERRLYAGQLHRDPALLSTAGSAPVLLTSRHSDPGRSFPSARSDQRRKPKAQSPGVQLILGFCDRIRSK
ncbi:protein of unknown function [Methylorubrum extorquens]|uniref:Uncharacterized protein n=1 Tax=Methylorubrum extorquens TaxID=408 RepID=A0A2N9AVG7_METEX|nr:protein of unknown function [Methylorubrum extorquens]